MLAECIQATEESNRFQIWAKQGPTRPPELVDWAATRNEAQGILDHYRRSHTSYELWITEKPLAATRS